MHKSVMRFWSQAANGLIRSREEIDPLATQCAPVRTPRGASQRSRADPTGSGAHDRARPGDPSQVLTRRGKCLRFLRPWMRLGGIAPPPDNAIPVRTILPRHSRSTASLCSTRQKLDLACRFIHHLHRAIYLGISPVPCACPGGRGPLMDRCSRPQD